KAKELDRTGVDQLRKNRLEVEAAKPEVRVGRSLDACLVAKHETIPDHYLYHRCSTADQAARLDAKQDSGSFSSLCPAGRYTNSA
ncbi:MAG: hypothetical protein Q9167_007896, partial [Letrouitia subvulpina]